MSLEGDSFAAEVNHYTTLNDAPMILHTSGNHILIKNSSEQAIMPKIGSPEEEPNEQPIVIVTTALSPPRSSSPVPSPVVSHSSVARDIPVLHKTHSAPLYNKNSPDDSDKRASKMKAMFFIKSPFKQKKEEQNQQLVKSSSLPDLAEAGKNKKDCSIAVKVFEARNLPEARQRRKQAERNSKAFQRAQKMLLEVSSPNLMNFSDATDPYCLVQVEKMKMRTRTIEKKLNPFWCEEFTFEVQNSGKSKVVLTIVDDKKYAQQDEVIGRLVLPINSFRDQREREQWFPIQHPHSSNKIPQVHMYIAYEQASAERKPLFIFQVLGGRNLGLGVPGAAVPYLDLSWKLKDNTTKEEQWVWNEIHSSTTERELPAALEMFNITLWRWKLEEDYEDGAPSGSNGTSPGKEKLILGQIAIPLVDLSSPRDYWFCLYGKDAGLGDLRIKIKYTEEVVLTMEQYQDFLELLQEPSLVVVHTLGAVAKPNTREGIAYNLVRVFEKTGKAVMLLDGLNSEEIDSTPNPDIIFRGNSLATKSVDQYMKLVGMPYLAFVLKALIKKLYISSKSCEVDPTKLEKGDDLKQNWKNLLYWVNLYTDSIFESLPKCPLTFRQVFLGIQQKCQSRFPGDIARFTAVSGFIFLRFFCPAILAPKLFNLAPDHPGIKQTRHLILIAKTLQNLANLVEFGSVKEEFMKNMNEFVVANMDNMRGFIDKISTAPENPPPPSPATGINLEKELASMYRHLLRHRDEMVEHHKGNHSGLEVMTRMNCILERLESQVKIANATQE